MRDVVHVAWSGRYGGIERLVETFARTARARGGRPHRVLLLDGRGAVGDRLIRDGLAIRLGLRSGWDPVGLGKLALTLRRLRPGILHFHTHAVASHLVAVGAAPHAIRVYTENSPRALGRDPKLRLLYRLLLATRTAFTAPTDAMANALVGNGVERTRIALVANGVAIPEQRARARGSGATTVGLVARLERQKRPDVFLDVVAALRARGVECAGVIVGTGSLRSELVRRREELGLADVVELPGEQDDLAPWFDRMDVFLMTSEREPYGIAAVEAMARGVPVVAMPSAGGLVELVARGGLVLADRDVATAADALQRLLAAADERESLVARGEAVADDHRSERVLDRLEDLYRSLGA